MRAGTIKFILLINCAIGVLAAFLISAGFSSDRVGCIAPKDSALLTADRRYAAEDAFSGTLCINGAEAPYDENTKTYYVPQSLKTAGYDCELTWRGLNERAHLIADAEFSNKESAIASGERFRLVLVDDNRYAERGVVFTGLPMCVIRNRTDLAQLTLEEEERAGSIAVFDPDGGGAGRYTVTETLIRYAPRGNTSREFDKPQYTVHFVRSNGKAQSLALLGLRRMDRLYFNSMYADETKVRDRLAMRVWETLCAASAGRGNSETSGFEYTEVVEDGAYTGLYGLMDQLGQDGSAYRTAEGGVVYKLRSSPLRELDENGVYTPYPTRTSCLTSKIVFQPPASAPVWAPISDYATALYARFDTAKAEDVHQRVLLTNMIDYSIYIQVTANGDTGFLNAFLYAEPDGQGGYRMHKLPWDLDCTFGKAHNFDCRTHFDFASVDYEQPEIAILLRDEPEETGALLAERYFTLREDVYSERALISLLKETGLPLTESGALARDAARWPECGNTADVSDIEAFIRLRLEYLDAYYAGMVK